MIARSAAQPTPGNLDAAAEHPASDADRENPAEVEKLEEDDRAERWPATVIAHSRARCRAGGGRGERRN
jgi:hypothetical protein